MEAGGRSSSTADQCADERLSVVNDVETATVEVQVHGRWSLRLCQAVTLALRSCLAEHPVAIIVDLSGLKDLNAASTATWLVAGRAAQMMQPPVRLMLALPPTRQLVSHLRQIGAARILPIYPTVKQARRAAVGRHCPWPDLN